MSSRLVIIALSATASSLVFSGIHSMQLKTGGQRKDPGTKGAKGAGQREYPAPKAAWEIASIILGNPTDQKVSMAIRPRNNLVASIEYGVEGKELKGRTPATTMKAGESVQVTVTGLGPNGRYSYRLRYKEAGDSEFKIGPTYSFQTQRSPGSHFSFIVQGDSHPERNPKMNVPALYERTLISAEQAKPDFFICLGDDFSVDTLRERTKETVEGAYLKQVPYLGLIGRTAPVYLVNGNHEQASKANYNGESDCLSVWAQNARNRCFPQPAPDGFYTGNSEKLEHIGFLRNYFAWTWGDALFVTIDPYWHSDQPVDNAAGGRDKGQRDLWKVTLGDTQYAWLKKTLEDSKAKFKFVFAHHVHGTGRGGVEQAPYYEWGGKSRNGSNDFKANRPSWPMPIHQLFVKNGVTIFFQGHDHIFAKQELDGVIYQSCPVPADASNQLLNGDAYRSGDKVVGAGLVRVTVAPDKTNVEFLRSFLPEAEVEGHKHGEVAYSYSVTPRRSSR